MPTDSGFIPTCMERIAISLTDIPRGTGPALLKEALHTAARRGDASIAALCPGHPNPQMPGLADALERGFRFVEGGDRLLAIGSTPVFPDTQASYIQRGNDTPFGADIFRIRTIADCPGESMAEKFLASGEFAINSHIFLGRAKAWIRAFERYAPETFALFNAGEATYLGPRESEFVEEAYLKATASPIEYAVMDLADNAFLLRLPPANR